MRRLALHGVLLRGHLPSAHRDALRLGGVPYGGVAGGRGAGRAVAAHVAQRAGVQDQRLGVPGELRIYRSLPHTFVSFPHWHVLPEVQAALRQSIELLQAACWPHTAAAAEAAKAAAAHAQYGIGGTESEEEAKDVSMPMRPRAGSITRGRGL